MSGVDVELGEVKSAPAPPQSDANVGERTADQLENGQTRHEGKGAEGAEGEENKQPEAEPLETLCDPCMKLYLFTAMGHEFHCTEVFCLLALGGAVVAGIYVMKDGKLETYYFSIILTIYSALALIFVWGYARIASLAELAEQLGHVAKKTGVEARKYSLINKTLADQADVYNSQLDVLHQEGDELLNSAQEMERLIGSLEQMQKKQEDLCKLQIDLGDREDQFAEESKLAAEDKDKELIKNALRIKFEQYTQVTGASGTIENTQEHRDAIIAFWKNNKLPGEEKVRKIMSDGRRIMCHTLVSVLDESLNTRFYRLKFAKQETAEKLKEVSTRKKKMKKQLAQYADELNKVGKDEVDLEKMSVEIEQPV